MLSTQKKPVLSIITITYKDPVGLEKTLSSLTGLAAEGISFESVVVDSSPDVNEAVFEKYRLLLPMNHISAERNGIYPAFNVGVENVNGELVWFLNGGDMLTSAAALKGFLHHFDDGAASAVVGGVDLYRNDEFLYSRVPSKHFLLNIAGANRVCHQGVIYRTASFKKVGGFRSDLKLAGDYEHHFRFYASGQNVKIVPDRIAKFDMGGASSQYVQSFEEFKKVHRRLAVDLPLHVTVANELLRPLERLRVDILKKSARLPIEPVLRKVWLAWHRRLNRI